MSDYPLKKGGKTTIAPEVLLTIARLSTLQVEGVSRMVAVPSPVNRLLKKNMHLGDGVCIEVVDDTVCADIFVVMKGDVNVRQVGQTIQCEVSRAIDEMVGMTSGTINIHIEDIDYPTTEA